MQKLLAKLNFNKQPVKLYPFVKWAGGKRQIINIINDNLPPKFSSNITKYVEPFIGGGSMLFNIMSMNTNISQYIINDINTDLINVYNAIKYDHLQLIYYLNDLQINFNNSPNKKNYYQYVKSLYNDRFNENNKTLISAYFIFLNKTCFNGIYRVNSKNIFNVPFNNKNEINVFDESNIININKALQKVTITNTDYKETIKYASENTFFYLDPPYMPVSKTSNFNAYYINKFSETEQYHLFDFCNNINNNNALFLMSNSDTSIYDQNNTFFQNLYKNYKISYVKARRNINSNANKRNKINELLIKNYD